MQIVETVTTDMWSKALILAIIFTAIYGLLMALPIFASRHEPYFKRFLIQGVVGMFVLAAILCAITFTQPHYVTHVYAKIDDSVSFNSIYENYAVEGQLEDGTWKLHPIDQPQD